MSLKETIVGNVSEYLESTTIHGFSYLSVGRNIIEKIVWAIIICTCFTLGALLIKQSIEEAHINPVMTNVETIAVSEVPFPAITVDSGDPDPWGYAEKIFNGLAFFGTKGGDTAKLRETFSSETDDFFNELFDSYQPGTSTMKTTEIDTFTFICLNHPDEKEAIDSKLKQVIKQSKLDEQYFSKTMKQITDIKVSYSDRKKIDKNDSAYPGCEEWARHFIYLINDLDQSFQIGFGTFLSYIDKLSKSKNTEDFMKDYTKVNVSKVLSEIDTTSKLLVLFLFVKGEGRETFDLLIEDEGWCKQQPKECHFDPEHREEDPECCRIFSLQALNMTSVMSFMRDALQSPAYYNREDEIQERQEKLVQLPYDNILEHKLSKKKYFDVDPNARILACNYANEKTDLQDFDETVNCTHFHRSITSKGFGISFNTLDFWSLYKDMPFTNTFAKTMRPKGFDKMEHESIEEDQDVLYQDKNLIFPKSSGKSNEMFLILQAKWKPDLETEAFHVNLHDPTFVPNMLHGSNEVRPGATTTFTVWPQLIETSKDLSVNSVQKRSCQFNFEGSLKLFQNYHQDGCIFECLLEKSFEVANCTPWNYPYLTENQQTCNFEGAGYFEKQMKNTTYLESCQEHCPQECTKIMYTSSVSSEPFDVEGLCDEKYWPAYDPHFFFIKGNPNGLVRNFEAIVNGKDMSRQEFCKSTLQRIAIVQIRLASNLVTAIKRSQRVTLTGHIANIGETFP